MIVTRKTYWPNGLETEREIEVSVEEIEEFTEIQERRTTLGPGIDYSVITSPDPRFVDRFLSKK